MGILAHDKLRVQTHPLANGGQMIEGAHGHGDFVAHAAYIYHYFRRIFFNQYAGDTAYQTNTPVSFQVFIVDASFMTSTFHP